MTCNIFTFGKYKSKQVNVSGIQRYLAQIQGKQLRTENLNAANIYLLEIMLTKCKYTRIYRSLVIVENVTPNIISLSEKLTDFEDIAGNTFVFIIVDLIVDGIQVEQKYVVDAVVVAVTAAAVVVVFDFAGLILKGFPLKKL